MPSEGRRASRSPSAERPCAGAGDRRPIGVFDSGVGGLSVLRQIRLLLPAEDVCYLADQAHVPYGRRPLEEVRRFAVGVVDWLLERECKLIVVACNTASAAALHPLRGAYPGVPFVGMEPAVKPAAEVTRSRIVGVLATPATFRGELYRSVVGRFAAGIEVLEVPLPGLVERIEAGDLAGAETRRIIADGVAPLRASGADSIVLGCTHYPFVIDLIAEAAGPRVRVIDPSGAVARQVARLLVERGLTGGASGPGRVAYWTSGDARSLRRAAMQLIGEAGPTRRLVWDAAGRRLGVSGKAAGPRGSASRGGAGGPSGAPGRSAG